MNKRGLLCRAGRCHVPHPALMEVGTGAQKLLHQAARLGKRLDGRVLDQVPSPHPRSTTLPAAWELSQRVIEP